MRKLIYSMMVSVDGFVENPSGKIDWVTIDEELHSYVNEQMSGMDAFLHGRRLY